MVKRHNIRSFARQVAERFRPQRIVLFGSYAYGKPSADSDVDLLVVMPHKGHAAVQAAEIRKQIRAGFAMDLIVRSPAEIRKRLAMDDVFMKEILSQGLSLYDAKCSRVG